MSLSIVLEVVIGLSFLYASLSLVASGANELISSAFALRAKTLEAGLKNLLEDPKDSADAEPDPSAATKVTAEEFYGHHLIQSLFRSRRRLLFWSRPGRPSYIPSDKFALALLDRVVPVAVGAGKDDADEVTGAIAALPAGRVKECLDVLWRDAKGDADAFRKGVEGWFDQSMERVSGWYRRRVQMVLVVLGLLVAVGLNVNSITVTAHLWTDAPLRNAAVAQAGKASPPPADSPQTVGKALDNLQVGLKTVDGLSLPIGWGANAQPSTWYVALAGWILTAVAISLGAPFWFDVLGRAARLRSTGVRLQTSNPTSAETE